MYASIHLLTNIVRHAAFQTDLETAIKEGIRITDENFCKKVHIRRLLLEGAFGDLFY